MDAVELISLYNTLFYVSLALTVIGFGLAAFFFFYFRIPEVRALMTGKARAETVRRIEEQNAKTGTLRPTALTSGDLYPSGRTGNTGRTSGPVVEPPPQPQPQQEQTYETAVLQTAAAETSVLSSDETVVLGRYQEEDAGETAILHQPPANFRFDLTENTIVIHTNELI